ncbi:restriction endonuclease subunit S [Lysinibacillus contaminans]|uniref:restriction endonuclease subunit S n=1 Tax=Lysinibacillus contaminans TaxID=1293441 RepID=UPI0006AF68C0|nr:restriction endonuclease subunit S [Lysinibacillus contaminans]
MAIWNEIQHSSINVRSRFDSEFFLPEYVKGQDILEKKANNVRLTDLFWVSDGNHLEISKYFSDNPELIPYYRGKDINDFFLENATPIRIPGNIYNSKMMERSHFNYGDVLLSIVGTIGSLSIVTEEIGDATGSCKIAILRSKGIVSPFYLAAFLLSKYGQIQIKRNTRGAVQMGLILKDFVNIRVPIIPKEDQDVIDNFITVAIQKNKNSKALYQKAEKLFEEEVQFNKLDLTKPKSFESNYSTVVNGKRIDADYFLPHFQTLSEQLSTLNTKPLGKIVNFKKGVEVGSKFYREKGVLFIRVSNLKKEGIFTTNSDKYISENLYEKLNSFTAKPGEILLTKDGTIGTAYVVDEKIEGIISSGIMKLSLKDPTINQEYLGLVINSKICKLQIEQASSGALIQHWKPSDIAKLKIPILTVEKMQSLSELVVESKSEMREAKALLEKAKTYIEKLIEK